MLSGGASVGFQELLLRPSPTIKMYDCEFDPKAQLLDLSS